MEKNVTINRGKGFPHNGSIREMSALDGGALAEDEKRLRETENLLETEWDQVTDSDKKFSALDDSESENSDFLWKDCDFQWIETMKKDKRFAAIRQKQRSKKPVHSSTATWAIMRLRTLHSELIMYAFSVRPIAIKPFVSKYPQLIKVILISQRSENST